MASSPSRNQTDTPALAILLKHAAVDDGLLDPRLLVPLMRHIGEVAPDGFLQEPDVELTLAVDVICEGGGDGDEGQEVRGVEDLRRAGEGVSWLASKGRRAYVSGEGQGRQAYFAVKSSVNAKLCQPREKGISNNVLPPLYATLPTSLSRFLFLAPRGSASSMMVPVFSANWFVL